MLSKLKQVFTRGGRIHKLDLGLDDHVELSWNRPPTDPLDVAAWDRYWIEEVRQELELWMCDMFCRDRDLVTAMNNEGVRSVLCAGNGISREPRALAEAGFEVVALDISPKATEIARALEFPQEAFEYYCEPGRRRPGGHVEFVVGDILDSEICAGLFDVIIERRTAQLYVTHNLGAVLGALAQRLDHNGIFFSHCHDGRSRPPAKPRHFTEPWFQENGWTIWNGSPGRKPPGRVAMLSLTTG